jgi:hypothetical protein
LFSLHGSLDSQVEHAPAQHPACDIGHAVEAILLQKERGTGRAGAGTADDGERPVAAKLVKSLGQRAKGDQDSGFIWMLYCFNGALKTNSVWYTDWIRTPAEFYWWLKSFLWRNK